MAYRWKPSASQRRAFAEKMKDPGEQAAYYQRKNTKEEKRRSTSDFDYEKAGGNYVPTRAQYDFCMNHYELFETSKEKDAANFVISAFSLNEKVHHDYIHIVNEKIRSYE